MLAQRSCAQPTRIGASRGAIARPIAPARHLSRRSCVAVRAVQNRLEQVLAAIDKLNSEDPRKLKVDGQEQPYELVYSRWLSEWVQKLTADGNPPVTEEVLIVARGQHVKRWTSPRSSYPEGRAGYLKWREELKRFHARTVAALMAEAGYPPDSLAKVDSIINKKNLKDAEHQVIEDALCLVFLERQFADFRAKESEEKMIDILQKTWKKMSPKGREVALSLKLAPEEAALVAKALAG